MPVASLAAASRFVHDWGYEECSGNLVVDASASSALQRCPITHDVFYVSRLGLDKADQNFLHPVNSMFAISPSMQPHPQIASAVSSLQRKCVDFPSESFVGPEPYTGRSDRSAVGIVAGCSYSAR